MSPANDNKQDGRPEHRQPERPCPICGKPSTREMWPFCSKRCADVDLHRWLGGHYSVPIETTSGDEDTES